MSGFSNSLDIVIPVLNEENALESSVHTLVSFCQNNIGHYDWFITVADNGSTDHTLQVAEMLSEQYSRVRFIRLEERGRGRALKMAWSQSEAAILAYMDVDLSTDLNCLPQLLESLSGSKFQIAIGSRLISGSKVVGRSFKREFISRCYSILFRIMFFVSFKDAQCGFKAISRQVAQEVVPLTKNNGWFFDTELLILAAKRGYQIKSLPVTWIDDPESSVNITSTVKEDLKGLFRLRFRGIPKITGPIDV